MADKNKNRKYFVKSFLCTNFKKLLRLFLEIAPLYRKKKQDDFQNWVSFKQVLSVLPTASYDYLRIFIPHPREQCKDYLIDLKFGTHD